MKKMSMLVIGLLVINCSAFAGGCNTVKNRGGIHQETDQTDALAIPLDESEYEEEEQVQALERNQTGVKRADLAPNGVLQFPP